MLIIFMWPNNAKKKKFCLTEHTFQNLLIFGINKTFEKIGDLGENLKYHNCYLYMLLTTV